jgi:hypothetical protein
MSTITFNDKEYEVESLSPRAQAIITLIQRNEEQRTLFNVAKDALLLKLEDELEGSESMEVAPPKPRPQPAVKRKPAADE